MKSFLTLFNLGKMPFGASLASLIALIIFSLIQLIPNSYNINIAFFGIILLLSIISICKEYRYMKTDRKEIVADELLGMYLCLIIVNSSNIYSNLYLLLIFRIIDIFKFPPFSTIDNKIKNGLGVFLDDAAIGLVIGLVFLFIQNILY